MSDFFDLRTLTNRSKRVVIVPYIDPHDCDSMSMTSFCCPSCGRYLSETWTRTWSDVEKRYVEHHSKQQCNCKPPAVDSESA